jgi:glycosyltransferase involved in cell wall biosynthesis
VKLSVYTFVRDGLYYDLHVVAMLRHHLDLADEIVVNEGYSSDGTYEAIRDISPKIRIVRNHWDQSDPKNWYVKFKNAARQLCTGDWCILLDCDEFIAEWEFEPLRRYLETTRYDIIPIHYTNFFGNYRVYNANPARKNHPILKNTIHRNRPDMEVWGDGANVRRVDDSASIDPNRSFECHHFGGVCNPARLRQKWRTQALAYHQKRPQWSRIPGFVFDLLPYRWNDEDLVQDYAIYEGSLVKAVREQPDEFVRDNFELLRIVERRQQKKPW